MTTINSINSGLTGQTGTGAFVGATSPTLVTPVLGTPQSGDLSNCTAIPAAQLTGIIPAVISAPGASSAATLALGTAYQNTSGHDVMVTVYLAISTATNASILLGVGPTNTPTQQTIISSLTLAALGIVPVNIYIPNNYYALLSESGTITETISGQITMQI